MIDTSINEILLELLSVNGDPRVDMNLEKLTTADWECLLQQAGKHGALPLLSWKLKALKPTVDIPSSVRRELREAFLRSAGRNVMLYYELKSLLRAFQEVNLPVIGLKGVHLAAVVYEDVALRPMGDLDLMVSKENLDQASEILRQQGYLPSRRFRSSIEAEKHYHLPPFYKPNFSVVEIHWTMARPTGPVNIAVEGLWTRAQPVQLADTQGLVLSPEDLLLVLCIHICRDDFRFGLKNLYDIALTLAFYEDKLDWEQLFSRAEEWQAVKCIYLSFYLARDLLQAPVPTAFMSKLRPDDFSPQIGDSAKQRVLNPVSPGYMNQYLLRLWGAEPLKGKVFLFLDSIFPPREAVAQKYSLPLTSPKVYFYYFVRLKDLFQQYGKLIWQVMRRDSSAIAAVRRENLLNDWWMST